MARPRKKEGQAPTWDRVLDAAEAAFSRKGFRAASVNEIAAEAGIRGPSLLYHFGTKENLYREVLRRFYRRVDALLDPPLTAPGPRDQRMRRFGKALARIERENRELIGVLNRELFGGEGRGADVVREAFLPILERVEGFLRDVGQVSDGTPLRQAILHGIIAYATASGLRASGLQVWANDGDGAEALATVVRAVTRSIEEAPSRDR